jgi:secreted Zn-dependent insulinase-like peptidase
MTDEINRSKIDLKEYKIIHLPCKLEVLLVSTLELARSRGITDFAQAKSAAAMSVQVGSFADPSNAGMYGCLNDFIA